MSRGFLVGLLWGLVVTIAGLAVLSVVAPMDGAKQVPLAASEAPAEPAVAKPAPAPAPAPALAPEPAPEPVKVPEAAPVAKVEPAAPQASPPQVTTAEATAPKPDAEAAPEPAAPESEVAPSLPKVQPSAPEGTDADAAPLPDAGTMPAPKQDKLLDPPESPQVPGADPAPPAPGPESGSAALDPTAPKQPVAPPAEAPAEAETQAPQPAPEPAAPEVTAPEVKSDAKAAKSLPGVTADRLPRVGAAKAAVPEPLPLALQPELPIVAHARAFAPDPVRPRFAVILQDIGAAGMSRADLAGLPFAVTFVIDASAPDAAEAAQTFRDAGHEVMIALGPQPPGTTPADLEQSFQALAMALPQTVAVLDAPAGGLQENRLLATQAIPILKAQGRGIVTFDRGLGAAGQVAAREGLSHATIFRTLDAEGEAAPVIRRYLDRAAFKAAQEGQVVVFGQTRPETVAAILEWLVEGRGASVQMAPVTAVMTGG